MKGKHPIPRDDLKYTLTVFGVTAAALSLALFLALSVKLVAG